MSLAPAITVETPQGTSQIVRDRNHWEQHAAQWSHVGSPLRPAPQDIRLLENLASAWTGREPDRGLKALLLGVTPEIAMMDWPRHTRLTAVDRCMQMIREVWPAEPSCEAQAICGAWMQLPVPEMSIDLALGDGCCTLLSYPQGYLDLFRSIRRTIKTQGVFVSRFFIRPDEPETVKAVFSDLLSGQIGNFHSFKWRLAMSLHGNIEEGVRLADVWNAWHTSGLSSADLHDRFGWPIASVEMIDAYQGVDTRYTFPTLDEVRAVASNDFIESACSFPRYELGERCPTLVFRPSVVSYAAGRKAISRNPHHKGVRPDAAK